jgi:hypothetical protein
VAAGYTFRTTFELGAVPGDVLAAVLAPERWLGALRHVRELERLRAGEGERGPTYRTTVAAVMPPYRLRWDMEATRLIAAERIEWRAEGDLHGTGTWRFTPTLAGTEVVSEAQLATTRRWMKLLEPLARPVFVRNHDLVMRAGVDALASHLGTQVRRYECGDVVMAGR